MKKRLISLTLVVCILFSLAGLANAGILASSQLERYGIALTAKGNSDMAISIFVDGVTEMEKIGVNEVFIEERNTATSGWHEFDTYYGMDDKDLYYDFDSYDYIRTLHFDGTPGKYYRVTIIAFGKNSAGMDTGTVTSSTVLCK